MSLRVKRLQPGDELLGIAAVNVIKKEEDVDTPTVTAEYMARFLACRQNVLLVGIDEEIVVGFLLAYELDRIDCDRTMMFCYEISVLSAFRRRGIGTALMNTLKTICVDRQCMKLWVPTDRQNTAAMALYRVTGGQDVDSNLDEVSFTWTFETPEWNSADELEGNDDR